MRKILLCDDAVGDYFADDAYVIGLAIRIRVHANVFLGHFVDVSIGTLLGDLGDVATDGEPVEWILVIDDVEADLGLLLHIEGLAASLRRVNQDVCAVKIDPDGRDLWCAIGHDGCQVCEDGLLKEVEGLLWNLLTHIVYYFLPI